MSFGWRRSVFDDPAGAVGIETMLVMAGSGPVYQVPLTYRDAALEHGDDWLVGIAEHSVLGRRWVYDACGDPVYAAVLTSAIFAGAGQAAEAWGRRAETGPKPPGRRGQRATLPHGWGWTWPACTGHHQVPVSS